jgi:predicted dehydrogenase
MSGPGVAVIGTSFGCLTHVRALRAAGFDVVALVGRDAEKTAERADRFEVAHASTDMAAVLSRADVSAVTVATPPHTHADLVRAALSAGKHVMCEKPFARDAEEARSVHAAAEAADVVHLLGCEFRYDAQQALVARLIAEGAIGAPRLAMFLLHIPLLAAPGSDVPEWWSSAADGGGWLGAQASHTVDQVRVTLGEFAGVSAALANLADHGWTAEDTFSVRFRTETGCEGFMQSTAADWGPILMSTRITGTTGTVWIDHHGVHVADAAGQRAVEVPADLRTPEPDPPPGDLLVTSYDLLHFTGLDFGPYVRLFEHFRARIEGTSEPAGPAPATFADGVAAMEVMDAIRRSARDGTWADVP